MARIVKTIDDLSGVELAEEVEPTKIAVDGTEYELDLGSASKDKLLKWLNGEGSLIEYRSAADTKSTRKTATATDDDGYTQEDKAAARHWAIDTGFQFPSATEKDKDGKPVLKTLGSKGRIPKEVLAAWDADGRKPIPND